MENIKNFNVYDSALMAVYFVFIILPRKKKTVRNRKLNFSIDIAASTGSHGK